MTRKIPPVVKRWRVEEEPKFIGLRIPRVPHPTCHCGYCGNFAHERYQKVVERRLHEGGVEGEKVIVYIFPLN